MIELVGWRVVCGADADDFTVLSAAEHCVEHLRSAGRAGEAFRVERFNGVERLVSLHTPPADRSTTQGEETMAKNSIEAYGALGKSNVLFFDPEALVLVTDEASPLYDSRVHLPVSEPLVLNIMAQGVLQAVTVAKNPETGAVEVVAGRQRVKAAREANRRLAAKGCEPVQVPAIPRKGNDAASLAGVMVSENELREADTPIGRAEKMVKLAGLGRSEAELAVIFGCTVATVRSTMALLEAPAAVREAVQQGDIGVTQAKALAKLPAAEQREKVAQLKQVAATTVGHAKARAQRAVIAPDAPKKMRSRVEVQRELDAAVVGSDRHTALAWVLGQ